MASDFVLCIVVLIGAAFVLAIICALFSIFGNGGLSSYDSWLTRGRGGGGQNGH